MTEVTVLLLGYFVVLASLLRSSGASWFRFDLMATMVWCLGLSLSLLPVVAYPTDVGAGVALAVGADHLCLVFGFSLARRRGREASLNVDRQLEGQIIAWLRMAALTFCMVVLLGALFQSRVPVIDAASSIAENRQVHWSGQTAGTLARLGTWLSYPASLFLIAAPRVLVAERRWDRWVVGATAIAFVDVSFQVGQRASITIVLIGATVVYASSNVLSWSTRVIQAGLAITVVFGLGSVAYSARNPDFQRAPDSYLAYNCSGAYYGRIVANQGSEVKALALTSCYFSGPLHQFEHLAGDYQPGGGSFAGLYNLAILDSGRLDNERLRIANSFRAVNRSENPWATASRDLWIDLGEFSFLGALILGLVFGRIDRPVMEPLHLLRRALLANCAFFWPFISPLVIRSVMYPLLATYLLHAAARHVIERSGRSIGPRASSASPASEAPISLARAPID